MSHTIEEKSKKRKQKLLVLDLDETIICGCMKEPESYDFKITDGLETFYIKKRPGLDEFLKTLHKYYEFVVWSASGETYANLVVKNIFTKEYYPHVIYSNKNCAKIRTTDDGLIYTSGNIKPLKKLWRRRRLGYSREEVIVIDDKRETFRRNFGNAILAKAWDGLDYNDMELEKIARYLITIKDVANVRSYKRGVTVVT